MTCGCVWILYNSLLWQMMFVVYMYSYNIPLKYILTICNLRYHCIICLYHTICLLTNLILVCAVLLDDAILCPWHLHINSVAEYKFRLSKLKCLGLVIKCFKKRMYKINIFLPKHNKKTQHVLKILHVNTTLMPISRKIASWILNCVRRRKNSFKNVRLNTICFMYFGIKFCLSTIFWYGTPFEIRCYS